MGVLNHDGSNPGLYPNGDPRPGYDMYGVPASTYTSPSYASPGASPSYDPPSYSSSSSYAPRSSDVAGYGLGYGLHAGLGSSSAVPPPAARERDRGGLAVVAIALALAGLAALMLLGDRTAVAESTHAAGQCHAPAAASAPVERAEVVGDGLNVRPGPGMGCGSPRRSLTAGDAVLLGPVEKGGWTRVYDDDGSPRDEWIYRGARDAKGARVLRLAPHAASADDGVSWGGAATSSGGDRAFDPAP